MYKYCNNLQNRFNNGDPFKYSIKISGNYSNKKLNKSDQIQFVKYSFTTFYLFFLIWVFLVSLYAYFHVHVFGYSNVQRGTLLP